MRWIRQPFATCTAEKGIFVPQYADYSSNAFYPLVRFISNTLYAAGIAVLAIETALTAAHLPSSGPHLLSRRSR